jgi:phytanoyl-CoA hydroxylase
MVRGEMIMREQVIDRSVSTVASSEAAISPPVDVDDRAEDPYLQLSTPEAQREYYKENGYVVIRNLLPAALCDQAKEAFEREVKPFNGYLYRQASANPEKHQWTSHGYMLNSILNIQDISEANFPAFRQAGLAIITHANMHNVLQALLGEEGKVVQSMFFEGNPKTWAHQDTYYLDSSKLGEMIGAWIAVEDIQPGAGRFFIYPGSHKIDVEKNGGDFDIAFHHERYKALVLEIIAKFNLRCQAPVLKKGDVLFWSSKTIHGSLETTEPEFSRASFTAHVIPKSTSFLQYQTRVKPLNLRAVNGIDVNFPKDQNEFKNKAVMAVETTFPRAFRLAKKIAIKLVTK